LFGPGPYPSSGFAEQDSFRDVTGSPQLQVTLSPTDSLGHPISSIPVGGQFYLQALVQDVSQSEAAPLELGVFAAFVDVTWNASLAAVTGGIDHGGQYVNAASGNTATAGLIDEAGGTVVNRPPTDPLLFRVPMQATTAGA